MWITNTQNSPVVVVSTVMLRSKYIRESREKVSNSRIPSSAVLFRRNTFRRSKKESKKLWKPVLIAGYQVVDVGVELYDGSYHEVDSSEMAFKIAASMAFREAAKKAKPVLLEPIFKVEVTVPEEYMGDVIGDISSRRGRIEGSDMNNGAVAVRGVRSAFRNVRICYRPAFQELRAAAYM